MFFTPHGITIKTSDGDVILAQGQNIQMLPQGNTVTISSQSPAGVVINNVNAWQPPSVSDANAPNGSVYYSTDAGKLVFKTSAGIVHNLY